MFKNWNKISVVALCIFVIQVLGTIGWLLYPYDNDYYILGYFGNFIGFGIISVPLLSGIALLQSVKNKQAGIPVMAVIFIISVIILIFMISLLSGSTAK